VPAVESGKEGTRDLVNGEATLEGATKNDNTHHKQHEVIAE